MGGGVIPRKKRIWYEGAVYHVTGRGNQKKAIFYDQEDYLCFLNLLQSTKEKYDFILHGYCLMPNHYHLLIQTKDKAIWNIMKPLIQNYTGNYNYKYDSVGHVFQGRYNAELIENKEYFLNAFRYIQQNPVKANIVTKAENYLWSSYPNYMGKITNELVDTEMISGYFDHSIQKLNDFVKQKCDQEEPAIIVQ